MAKSFPPTKSLFGAATPITGAAQAAGGTATAAGPLAAAAAISPIADIGSFALGISEALAADKGFSFNLCSFTLDLKEEVEHQPGSVKVDFGEGGGKVIVSYGPVFFSVLKGDPSNVLERSAEERRKLAAVELGIRYIVSGRKLIGIVDLRTLDGFDTAIGDNLAVEVVAQDFLPAGVVLVVKGFINPYGRGYAHFVGAVLVRVTKSASLMSGNLTILPLFIRQTPRADLGYTLQLGEDPTNTMVSRP